MLKALANWISGGELYAWERRALLAESGAREWKGIAEDRDADLLSAISELSKADLSIARLQAQLAPFKREKGSNGKFVKRGS